MAPGGDIVGVDGGADIVAHEGELFAEIDAGAEFGDGLLAGGDFTGIAGGEEPFGESRFAGGGADGGEKFEERSAAEEIEIVGVDVFGIAESVALIAFADPFFVIAEAIEGAFEIVDAAPGGGALTIDAIVDDGEGDEDEERKKEPPSGDRAGAEGGDRDDDGGDRGEESGVAELPVAFLGGGVFGAPVIEALLVLLGREHEI